MPLCIAIRSRVGLAYGWGHYVRSTRLARHIKEQFPSAHLHLVVEGDNDLYRSQDERELQWIMLPNGASEMDECHWIERIRPDIIIVDLLEIPFHLNRLFREASKLLVAFSDLARTYPEPDVLICPQVLSSYPTPIAGQHFLVGPRYFVLDDSFRPNAEVRHIRRKVEKVLVVMGGCLPPKVEAWTRDLIKGMKKQEFQTQVVIGFSQAGTINYAAQAVGPRVSFIEGTQKMGRLMWEADLAIAASGYVKLELAASGTPMILVSITDHQNLLGTEFAGRTRAACYVGNIQGTDPKAVIEAVKSLAHDVEMRRAMSEAGRRAVDGRGTERILRGIMEAWERVISKGTPQVRMLS